MISIKNIKIVGNIIFCLLIIFEIAYIIHARHQRDKELNEYNLKKSPAADSCMYKSIKIGLITLFITILIQTTFNLI